jgi:hypothetical protein
VPGPCQELAGIWRVGDDGVYTGQVCQRFAKVAFADIHNCRLRLRSGFLAGLLNSVRFGFTVADDPVGPCGL